MSRSQQLRAHSAGVGSAPRSPEGSRVRQVNAKMPVQLPVRPPRNETGPQTADSNQRDRRSRPPTFARLAHLVASGDWSESIRAAPPRTHPTIASSTTIRSPAPGRKQVQRVDRKAERAAKRAKGADQRDRHGRDRDQVARRLQERTPRKTPPARNGTRCKCDPDFLERTALTNGTVSCKARCRPSRSGKGLRRIPPSPGATPRSTSSVASVERK